MLTSLLIITACLAFYLVYRRSQNSTARTKGLVAPPNIRAAAKRLGFIPMTGADPIASLHSAELCIAAMAVAFAQMDANTKADTALLAASSQRRLGFDATGAQDATVLGEWLVTQGGGPTPAFKKLTKRLKQLDHGTYFDKLMHVMGDVTAAGTKGMPSAAQADAMGALASIFRTA